MTNLKEHIKDQLKSVPALDGIIIMCDSDITDVVFDKISDDQAAELLSAYTADLIYIIRAAQNASVPLAISSPVGVLLEGPLGAPDSVRYHDKRDAVVAYSGGSCCIEPSCILMYRAISVLCVAKISVISRTHTNYSSYYAIIIKLILPVIHRGYEACSTKYGHTLRGRTH